MTGQQLPIIMPPGVFLPGSACLVLGIMHYPDDPISSRAYYQSMLLRQDQLKQSGPKAELPRILELLASDMNRRIGKMTAAAIVLDRIILIHQTGEKASLRKAYAAAAKLIVDQPSMGRKRANIPSDERAIRNAFMEFRSIAHLWLAFIRCERDLFALLRDEEKLKEFLTLSEGIGKMVTQALPNTSWDRWCAPLEAQLQDSIYVYFRDEPEIKQFLSQYSTVEYRDE